MFRTIIKTLGMLAITLSLSLGVLAMNPVNVALAASQPTLASVNLPVASDPTGQGTCLPSGYNLNGWRCGWRLYNYGGYAYGTGGYYSPSYGAYEPNYCAPDGDWDVDDYTCRSGYAAPVYNPGYYSPYYYSRPFVTRPFLGMRRFFGKMR
jgi:hypothetical protein